PVDSRRAQSGRVFSVPAHRERPLLAGTGHHRRPSRVHSPDWSADRCGDHYQCLPAIELSALDRTGHLSRLVAPDPGLHFLAPHHGPECGTASPRCHFRCDGGRRDRRYPRYLPLHSRNGQPAHPVPALALVRGEEKVWPAQRLRAGHSDRSQTVANQSLASLVPRLTCAPAPTFFSTATLRRNSAAASGSTVLMNIPEPNSKPATR